MPSARESTKTSELRRRSRSRRERSAAVARRSQRTPSRHSCGSARAAHDRRRDAAADACRDAPRERSAHRRGPNCAGESRAQRGMQHRIARSCAPRTLRRTSSAASTSGSSGIGGLAASTRGAGRGKMRREGARSMRAGARSLRERMLVDPDLDIPQRADTGADNLTRDSYLRRLSPPLPYACLPPYCRMAQRPARSLKHEYELFVEREIENYKESVPRSVLLSIGDDAVRALAASSSSRSRSCCSATKSTRSSSSGFGCRATPPGGSAASSCSTSCAVRSIGG